MYNENAGVGNSPRVVSENPPLCHDVERRLSALCEEFFGITDNILSKIDRIKPVSMSVSPGAPMQKPIHGGSFFGMLDEKIDNLHAIKEKLYLINSNLSEIAGN